MFTPADLDIVRRGGSNKFTHFPRGGRTAGYVGGILGVGGESRKKVYADGFPGIPTSQNKGSSLFSSTLIQEKPIPDLAPLPEPTNRKIRIQGRAIPYGAEYYDMSGKYISKLPRNTHVTFDNDKTISTRYNATTKKQEAFLKTESILSEEHGKLISSPLVVFLRATWLDVTVSPTIDPSKDSEEKGIMKNTVPQESPKTPAKKASPFSGHFGIKGTSRPLSPLLVEAVMRNYCNTFLIPKVFGALESTSNQVRELRKKMVAACLTHTISLKETQEYQQHQKFLEQETKLKAFGYALKSFTLEKKPIVDPTIESVITSIQKTRDWQDILTKTSLVEREIQKGKGKAPRGATLH